MNPCGVYRCAGGLGSKFFIHVHHAVLEGSTIPDCFAESRAVFIPKTTDTDDIERIFRSLDALRPLTLCNCDCKLLTSAVCRGLHWYTIRCVHPSQRCISSWQMICCCISRSRALDCPTFSSASYEAFTGTALHTWNLREQNEDNS